MEKPIIKQVSKDYNTGSIIGELTHEFNVHWSNDFVKTGKEYELKSKKLTPAANKLFYSLIYNHMDFGNKLVNDDNLPMSQEDMSNLTGTKQRRTRVLLAELFDNGLIGKFKTNTIKCFIVNPVIAIKSRKTTYAVLNLFSEYYIESLDKKLREAYDLKNFEMYDD